jgi:outer membrane lipoprotein-sorting protein
MKSNPSNTITAFLFIMLQSSFALSAQTGSPQQKGLWVAEQIDRADEGFVNQVSKATMTLRNKQGQQSIRSMTIKSLEVDGDGDKSLTIFSSPRDVKGTAFLSFTHALEPDDQWLFLPALKRVKRISSNNKSGPFMGSEFAYEDISSQEVEKYNYSYLREEEVLGAKGYVIERVPVDKKSGYTKQVVWVDGTHWRLGKIEFYDRKNEKLKTLTFEDYMQYPNKKWRSRRMEMMNHQTGKSTQLTWSDIKFGQDLTVRDFDQNALKRVR